MAGLLDNILKVTANIVIDLLGTTATITTYADFILDPVTGETSSGLATTETIKCSPPNAYRISEIDGTRILSGDMRIIVPYESYSTEPKTNQTIAIRDRTYKIVSVVPYSSGNSEAAWEIQLRNTGKATICETQNVAAGDDLVLAGGLQVIAEICE